MPQTLTVKNFISHLDSTFNYDDLSLALVIGQCGSSARSNGAGKSSFFIDGMLWSLFGKYRYKTKDDVVKKGEEEASAIFEFELNGKGYKIERVRNCKRGISKLAFFAKNGTWKNISDNNIIATQAIIDQTIGFSYEVFVDSVVAQQGDLFSFTSKEQSRKKELLEEVLQLSKFEKCETLAKQQRDYYLEQLAAVEGIEGQWQQLKKEIVQLEVENNGLNKTFVERQELLQKMLPSVEKTRQQLSKLQASAQAQEDLYNRESKIKNKLASLSSSIAATKSKLQRVVAEEAAKQEKLSTLKKTFEKNIVVEGLEEKISSLEQIQKELNKLKEQAAVIVVKSDMEKEKQGKVQSVSGTCPTCQQVIQEENKEEILSKIEATIKSYQVQHKELKGNFQQKKEQKEKLEQEITKLKTKQEERESLELEIKELENSLLDKERINELAGMIKTYLLQQDEVEMELNDIQNKIKVLGDITLIDKMQVQLNALLKEQREHEESLQLLQRSKGRIEGELKRLNVTLEDFQAKKGQEQKFKQEVDYYKRLVNIFGRNGIPAVILERVTVEIEKETNNILKAFGTDAIVEIHTQHETQAGSLVEAFNIIVKDSVGERPFELYSGGEAVRIAFALRIALSKILASRSGTQLRFLILDENLSFLDEEGIENFMNMLISIQKDFDKILVITHRQDLQQYFQQIIRVVKEKGSSRILI